jgi:hypothetical protein
MGLEKKMKTGFNKLFAFVFLFAIALEVFAAGTIIVTAVLGATFAATATGIAIAMAINLVVSMVVSKLLAPSAPSFGQGGDSGSMAPDVGNRQQVPPATDNKLPIVYGSAWVGGTITDLSITENNQNLFYVLSICEVTNTNAGQFPDTISFGDIYYGGKKVQFQENGHTVASLLDESTGIADTAVDGKINIYLYRNGSNSPVNTSQSAIQIMQSSGLVYQWDNTKLMTNTAFAIVALNYSQSANIRGIEQTRFQIINSRTDTGACFFDYLVNDRYGCAIPESQINTATLNELTIYSNQSFTYTTYDGNSATQARFKFNGVIDTKRACLDNLQDMSTCCDCLVKYNEIQAQWGVIVQKPTYTVAMNINDSNMISAISISPMDISSSYNIVECRFPDETNQDSFNTATFDLSQIAPALLYPNEPVNKFSLALPLVNNDVQAQYIANRALESAREDLNVSVEVNYIGLELESGDIVTVTNSNYGWVDKLFRLNKVIQTFTETGAIVVKLQMTEFNPEIYDDKSITQFTPSPNTGIGDPTFFGTVPAPIVASQFPTATNPSFTLNITTSQSGIIQYAEVWYSAFSNPLQEQMYFAGTSEVQSSGTPWQPNTLLPPVTLSNVPAGKWYFFTRMVNSLASSAYSAPSTLFNWRPYTVQFTNRYLVIAYADDENGTGFTTDPRNKSYFGFVNTTSSSPVLNPALYTWLPADPTFGLDNYLLFINRGSRRFSFNVGTADFTATTGLFVPTNTALFDPSIWSGLPDGTNYIDLDSRTGQLITSGTTTVANGEISVVNNAEGRVVASLRPLLNFGGSTTFTASVTSLTIDIFGRVLGFEPPDDYGYTMQQFTATSGQTVFTVTRDADYLINNCLVFQNGVLLDESEYTDTAGSTGTVTLDVGADLFDIVTIISIRAFNSLGTSYNAFTRNVVDLTNANSYTASGFTLVSGYELLFINGAVLNENDYDIVGQTITAFPNLVNGKLTIIQWANNNLDVPAGTPINVVANTIIGQDTYPFSYVANALNIYQNGVLLDYDTDYTAGFGEYTLAVTPDNANQTLLQQTFDRTTAA